MTLNEVLKLQIYQYGGVDVRFTNAKLFGRL